MTMFGNKHLFPSTLNDEEVLLPGWFYARSSSSSGTNNGSTSSSTLPASLIGSGSFKIKLVWDSSVTSSTFQNSIKSAALAISSALTDNITINLGITNTGRGGGASAGPNGGLYESYLWAYQHLKSSDSTLINYLPSNSSIQGSTQVAVWNAQLKLWGITPSSSLDGSATFATDINPAQLFGVALHELTHAFGRVPYGSSPDTFDFFRFTAPGVRLFSSSIPTQLAYFSIDGGVTNLAYYGTSSDPSDFYNGTPTGKLHSIYDTTNDAFSEYYTTSTNQYLSALDLHNLAALGFHLAPLATQNASYNFSSLTPVVISDTVGYIQNNLDNLNAHINSIYSISQSDAGPLNISATQSVNDSSILMLMNLYETLRVNINGTSSSELIYGIGNDVINGRGGIDTISLLCHTSSTTDTICSSSAVSTNNLEIVNGFLSNDNIQLTNSLSSLNGLTNLSTGGLISAGTTVTATIQNVIAGQSFTALNSTNVLDITGKTFANVAALITSLSSNSSGSTYANFGTTLTAGSHFLVEYSATDGTHIAEITQGTSSNHLASNSTGVDLIDLVGVTQHVAASNFFILGS